jgi:ferredoxin-NADP reductase
VTVHLTIDRKRVQRAYSLSSAPSGEGLITITVKRVPGGLVSNHLADHVGPGHVLESGAAAGHFVLPTSVPERMLMISAGSGITPVMSMLRDLIARGSKSEITFVHFARSPRDVIFGRELEAIADRVPNVRVVTCVEDADEAWSGERGRFDAGLMERIMPEFRAASTYLCGPSGFMQAVMETFERAGADLSKLHYERFNADFDVSRFLHDARLVRFVRTGVESLSTGPLTILQDAEAKGVRVESGCRAGTCGTCRCRKRKGVVVNVVTGEESGDGEEMINACVSVARGTVEVEL